MLSQQQVLLSTFLITVLHLNLPAQGVNAANPNDDCMSVLEGLANCIDDPSAAGKSTSSGSSNSDILKKCDALSKTAGCSSKIPQQCWKNDAFSAMKSTFDFANTLTQGCASAGGRRNLQDLTECNNKNRQGFESCFNFTVIDRTLSLADTKDGKIDFSGMCCVIKNGNACYTPIVNKNCGAKGKSALDGITDFLLLAMECKSNASGCH
ncbi:uncharacterized protein LOC129598678 [Paramacrobiotus metropolitanus]|uniref:uncharacterized protein LOC129598678 n=1 Tax=Paramacrobiotus metropolitanus TaxID=2943436 RepID=UPI002445E618|nr:uncharacterized protein LOC129598678 [Paramacrobiotus metropolitanus]